MNEFDQDAPCKTGMKAIRDVTHLKGTDGGALAGEAPMFRDGRRGLRRGQTVAQGGGNGSRGKLQYLLATRLDRDALVREVLNVSRCSASASSRSDTAPSRTPRE